MLAPPTLRRRPTQIATALLLAIAPAAAQDCSAPVVDLPFAATRVWETQGTVYASGFLGGPPAGSRLARLDPGGWTLLPGTFDAPVLALAETSSGPVAGGVFASVDGLSASGVARFDGAAWLPVGTGIDGPGATVAALAEFQGELYAGGTFAGAGAVSTPNLARFDGAGWTSVDGGLDGPCADLVVFDGDLIVAGEFGAAGSTSIASIAAWNGAQFEPLGDGPLGPVDDLDSTEGRLGVIAGGLLRLLVDGRWVLPGTQPFDLDARRVAFYDGGIFVAGAWSTFCATFAGDPCLLRAKFQEGQWQALSVDDANATVDALQLAASGEAVFEIGSGELLRFADEPTVSVALPFAWFWQDEVTYKVTIGCDDGVEAAALQLGPDLTLPLVPGGVGGQGGFYEVVLPPGITGATGAFDVEVLIDGEPAGLDQQASVLPRLDVVVFSLFSSQVRLEVEAGLAGGVALFFAALAPSTPVGLPGVFSPWMLDLGGAFFLGDASTDPPQFGAITLPIPPSLPPATTFTAQAIFVDLAEGGPFVAATPSKTVQLP
ncbi:MAG: hypothetical protein AAFZ65_01265 [Planctomycetota bacterium]